MNNYKEQLDKYYSECNKIKELFILRYFCSKNYLIEDVETYWIGDQVGSVAVINDYFFNIEDMVLALDRTVSKKKLFAYYDQSIEEKPDSLKTLYSYIHNNKNGKN